MDGVGEGMFLQEVFGRQSIALYSFTLTVLTVPRQNDRLSYLSTLTPMLEIEQNQMKFVGTSRPHPVAFMANIATTITDWTISLHRMGLRFPALWDGFTDQFYVGPVGRVDSIAGIA